MDSIGGARILSERLVGAAEPAPLPCLRTGDALPLYHWTGVEPALPPIEPVGSGTPAARRRLGRLTRKR
jgi:hypothetical protein